MQIPFTGTPGPTALAGELGADSEPVNFFELFVTDELLEMLVLETNRYAQQCIDKVTFLCIFHVVPNCCSKQT